MKIMSCSGLIILAFMLAGIAPAQAQYPTRPVRLLVPFPAGSANDIVARFVQPQLAAALGQQVVIDNRAGAAGNLGAEVAAKSPPDGYTVMMGNIAHSISVSLYSRLGYDLLQDFAPVTLVASGSFTLATHPSLPARSVKELIAFAKKRPGEINVATSGAAIRLAAKLLDSMAGTRMTEVNYKGTPQAITAVISGEASVGFPSTSAVTPHVRAGKLRALAVTSPKRSSMAPNVPTLIEAGVPGYEVTSWYGLMVPAGTPNEIVARLHAATVKAVSNPDVKSRFGKTDLELVGSTPEQFAEHVRREVQKWAKVVKESGMRVE
ncbi:MAG: tripartite tricarboxylate transporter substrate binding protein [Betaproteobacteria bacterium]|nr:tripartite tricarboxylate transporter substrate binding protein [Betaproteobacteria bacterium]